MMPDLIYRPVDENDKNLTNIVDAGLIMSNKMIISVMMILF